MAHAASVIENGELPILEPDIDLCAASAPSKNMQPCRQTFASLHGGGAAINLTFVDISTRSVSLDAERRKFVMAIAIRSFQSEVSSSLGFRRFNGLSAAAMRFDMPHFFAP